MHYLGGTMIPCGLGCTVPFGKVANDGPVTPSHHQWWMHRLGQEAECPTIGCGRSFLLTDDPNVPPPPVPQHDHPPHKHLYDGTIVPMDHREEVEHRPPTTPITVRRPIPVKGNDDG